MNDPSFRMNSSLEEVNALYQRLLELEQSNQQYQGQIEQLTQQLAQEKAARQQAEERLQLTLVSAQMVAWEMDLIADRILCSPNALEIWGIEAGTREAFFSLIHPDDRQQVMQAVESAIAGETDYLQEYRVICPDGAICWLNSRGRVDRDAAGRGVRVVGLSVDVTDRKQAEQQLQESQRFIQQIAAAMPGTLYVYDMLEQCNVYVNRQIGELLGYAPEQIQSLGDQLFTQLIHPDDFLTIGTQFERLEQAKDGEAVDYEYRMQHADGTWRWLWSRNTVSTRTPDGQAHQVVGTVHDITDRKQAEAELQQREQEFRTLVENTPDIIVRYDQDLRHLYINPSIEQALGMPPEQFIGKTGLELGFTDEFSQRWYATLQQVFETGQGDSIEYEFPNPQGEVRFYQAQFVPELTEGEHIKTVVAVARDVTEYKRTELSLRQ
ncbi:MAG TPA: PAS domain-containing protein, partial [Allocoleopsis sp.]